MTTATLDVHPGVRDFLGSGAKKLLINGKWVEAVSGRTFDTLNPATGEVLATVAEGDQADIDAAVAAARAAFENGPWKAMTPSQRGQLLNKIADCIEAHKDELAQLEVLDNGKTIREASSGDIPLSVDLFRYYAGWPTKIHGDTTPVSVPYYPGGKFMHYTVKEALGVVGAIIPWNFPLLMACERIAPILACGNTIVLKPAEQTPLSLLRLGELLLEAGVPEGVVNIVPGFGATAGAALAEHMDVDKVTFTGSTETGRSVMRAAAGNLKGVSLELGGKSPNIVFEDADMDQAAKGMFMGIFYNQGQTCSSGSRVFVQKKFFDQAVESLAAFAKKTVPGPGLHPKAKMGPLVSEAQMNRVLGYIEAGKKEGATLVCGGNRVGDAGYFVEPTVFTDVKDEMTIAKEEIFGPVVAMMPFEDEEEVLARANASVYGLVAGVWTKDIKKAFRMAQGLKAGVVWLNCYQFVDAAAPWGGYKQSGNGREKGPQAIDEYTQTKSVWVDLN